MKTHFSLPTLAKILEPYGFGKVTSASTFSEGTLHTNLLVETEERSCVFRYFENRSREWALFESELICFLTQQDYPTPKQFPARNGEYVGMFEGKPFSVFEFISGQHVKNPNQNPDNPADESIASWIARLHLLSQGFASRYLSVREGREIKDITISTERDASSSFETHHGDHIQFLESLARRIEWPDALPRSICHADINHTNFIFNDSILSAVIDFDMACYAPSIYDLGNMFYWWAWPPECPINFNRIKRILKAYESVRPLSLLEKYHLYDALKMVLAMGLAWSTKDKESFNCEKERLFCLEKIGRDEFLDSSGCLVCQCTRTGE